LLYISLNAKPINTIVAIEKITETILDTKVILNNLALRNLVYIIKNTFKHILIIVKVKIMEKIIIRILASNLLLDMKTTIVEIEKNVTKR